MIIFGGILDVCKELDDLLVYNIETRKWVQVLEELMLSPIKHKYGSLMPSATSPTDFTMTMPTQDLSSDLAPILTETASMTFVKTKQSH
jgi:hypothetical protein